MPIASLFGKRLRLAREQRNMTQEELAKRAAIPAVMVSHFETGTRQNASADTLVKLADALHVTVDYLLGRSESMEVAGEEAAAILRSLKGASDDAIRAARKVIEALARHHEEERSESKS